MPWARRIATTLFRSSAVNRAVRALARARGHRLVLVYHRIGAAAPRAARLFRPCRWSVFRAQLQALGDVVDFVAIDRILARDAAAIDRSPPAARRRGDLR